MIRRSLVAMAAVVLLLGAPGAVLASPINDFCTVPVLGWKVC